MSLCLKFNLKWTRVLMESKRKSTGQLGSCFNGFSMQPLQYWIFCTGQRLSLEFRRWFNFESTIYFYKKYNLRNKSVILMELHEKPSLYVDTEFFKQK